MNGIKWIVQVIPSCMVVFLIFPKRTTFQSEIVMVEQKRVEPSLTLPLIICADDCMDDIQSYL